MDINKQEIEVLKEIPPEKRFDFIERNWEKMRTILENPDKEHIEEEIEALVIWYRGI